MTGDTLFTIATNTVLPSLLPVKCRSLYRSNVGDSYKQAPQVNTACKYVLVNTQPVNTWAFFLREYTRGGEGVGNEAKIPRKTSGTVAKYCLGDMVWIETRIHWARDHKPRPQAVFTSGSHKQRRLVDTRLRIRTL